MQLKNFVQSVVMSADIYKCSLPWISTNQINFGSNHVDDCMDELIVNNRRVITGLKLSFH